MYVCVRICLCVCVCKDTYVQTHIHTYGYGSILINTIFWGMTIHLPAFLGFTRYQGFDPSPLFIGFQTSKVVQDFFHPQYVGDWNWNGSSFTRCSDGSSQRTTRTFPWRLRFSDSVRSGAGHRLFVDQNGKETVGRSWDNGDLMVI